MTRLGLLKHSCTVLRGSLTRSTVNELESSYAAVYSAQACRFSEKAEDIVGGNSRKVVKTALVIFPPDTTLQTRDRLTDILVGEGEYVMTEPNEDGEQVRAVYEIESVMIRRDASNRARHVSVNVRMVN